MNGSHGVFNVWFVADGEPSLQRHLAVIAGLAAVDDDRIVVRCAGQRHLKFIHRPVVAGDADTAWPSRAASCTASSRNRVPSRYFRSSWSRARSSIVRRSSSGAPLSNCLFIAIMPYFPLRVDRYVLDHPVGMRVFCVQV